MFNKIILFSIKNKLAIGTMTLVLLFVGIFSLSKLPIDAVPDITNNQVQIISQAPDLGAQEVEQFITAPIEMAMANIPEIIERRSISRSGISVLTLVFNDDTNVYWARQQVGTQLKEAEAVIPEGLSKPAMAPVTTGLGEIYQYVLHTKKGYEYKYSATDLRTIQDWMVRTQLVGTKGVAEVSGWGGYVKQYEIALDNEQLKANNVTITQIFGALKDNNENTGGAYIEQQSNAYAIRGIGQVKKLSDIERIVVKNSGGVPILVRDVGTVQFGSATRYGAVTRNGTGEVVAGVTLMLKGENFNKVIENVKERIAQIQKSLPEGVVIEPFIDRTELVGRAIGTVQKNLVEGALIVIFVLLLLLGNWRAGLIVASVIPLAMLFAFSMMYIFNVSGNLMSLGAVDFGLIVDGAVIIVEAILFRLTESKLFIGIPKLDWQQMDEEVYQATSKIRASATFGELIILVVYIPLLTLVGIEGKMFRPMAQTVAFAIIGAFILSLTYVPMLSALFLSKETSHKETISDKIMDRLKLIYRTILIKVLKFRKFMVIFSFLLFALSLFLFSRMGGEFLPQLEEGDLTVEISMAQGTSLSQVVETFGKAEDILKSKFPEVKQAVTRIGSAEIPTDPMPVERGDMMVSMAPKNEWKTATTKEEMTEKMEAALSVLPGVNIEITQPMQMRFNELMTGVRQDVAVKIYGEDLEILVKHAKEIAKLIGPVKGVSDLYIEQVSGLSQIVVKYDRDRIAQYGLSIGDVNDILRTAFAGHVAGVVFEGEKRFDMVVRLRRELRDNISNIENLYIPLPSGNKVPLSQVATISFENAPSQISREEGHRRTYVGFNVKGRDVERTVADIKHILDEKLKLMPGYYLSYGGQFQNLKEAKTRLSVALPVVMVLILLLLYITFKSVAQTLLIFSAVPLSAIGGIFALLLRDMPFSIPAGVGFIALFGVAVLNGIVMITSFNHLKEEGITNVYKRVLEGTKMRLRPVLITAAVASLGFLPMAISCGAGAEVQKPLATVVIGGLLSATFLTLFLLPCLYVLFTRSIKIGNAKVFGLLFFCGLFCLTISKVKAQSAPLSLERVIAMALEKNLKIKSAGLAVKQAEALRKSAFDPGKTSFSLSQDPTAGGGNDNSLNVSQTFAWPSYYKNKKKLLQAQTVLALHTSDYTKAEIIKMAEQAYYNYLFSLSYLKTLNFEDSIYRNFINKAKLRFKVGESSKLELLSAENKYREVQLLQQVAKSNLNNYELELRQLLHQDEPLQLMESELPVLALSVDSSALTPALQIYRQQVQVAKAKVNLERSKAFPDITIGYAQQVLVKSFNPANIDRNYFPGTRIAGVQLGLSIPVFGVAGKARLNGEKVAVEIAETDYLRVNDQLKMEAQQIFQTYLQHKEAVDYYISSGLKQAAEQQRLAQVSYDLGEIGYLEFIQNISVAIQSRLNYLLAANQLNQSLIQLQFLKGN